MTRFFWLLERDDSPVSRPIYVASRDDDTDRDPKGHAYTSDPFAAMRFATKADADRYAETFLMPGAVRVCEHGFGPYTPIKVSASTETQPAGTEGGAASTLPRYGLRWNGPSEPVSVPMADGYWTPWHLAADEITRLRAEVERLTPYVEAFRREERRADLLEEKVAEMEDARAARDRAVAEAVREATMKALVGHQWIDQADDECRAVIDLDAVIASVAKEARDGG